MWNSVNAFFKNMFGSSEEIVEDAAALSEEKILVKEDPTPEELAARKHEAARSRGGIGLGETITVEAGTPAEPICITNPRYLWLLDNGHGSLQAGKRSPKFEDGSQFFEWEFTRDIVRRMVPKLEDAGVQVHNLVPEDDVDSFLRERVDRANSTKSPLGIPAVLVSVHANAFGSGAAWSTSESARGIETWYFPGSDSGSKIASVFQREIMKALPGWNDRGIRSHQRGSGKIFYILRKSAMPAVLTENGFYTNKDETKMLLRDDVRELIAQAHVNAIIEIEQNDYEDVDLYRPNMILA